MIDTEKRRRMVSCTLARMTLAILQEVTPHDKTIHFSMPSFLRTSLSLFVILVCSFTNNGYSQHFPQEHNALSFKRYARSEEVPFIPPDAICQDYLGYMWFGTKWGLYRYDGYQSDHYHSKNNASNRIVDDQVTCLLEDRQDHLWIGTVNGLTRLDPFREQSIHFQPKAMDTSHPNYVRSIIEADDGIIWIGMNSGLYYITPQSETLSSALLDPDDPSSTLDKPVCSISEGDSGCLWFSCEVVPGQTVLINYDPVTYAIESYSQIHLSAEQHPSKWLVNMTINVKVPLYINQLLTAKNGLLWLGAWDGKLTSYNPADKTYTEYEFFRPDTDYLVRLFTSDMFEDESEWLWITANQFGLIRFHPESGRYYFYNDFHRMNGLGDEFVQALFQEKNGAVWIASELSLNRFDPYRANIQMMQFLLDDRVYPLVRDLMEDTQNRLWVATSGGLFQLDFTKSFEYFFEIHDSTIPINAYSVLKKDNAGEVWIGTHSTGVRRFNLNTGELTEFSLFPNMEVMHRGHVRDIAIDHNGSVWFATQYSGLVIYHPKTGTYDYTFPELGSTSALYVDSDGTVWVGTPEDGLYYHVSGYDNFFHYDYANHTFRDNEQTLIGSGVWDILEDSKGRLWVGTNQGLNLLDRKTGQIQYLSRSEGFSGVEIKSLLEADDGKIWMDAGRYGISSFDPDTNQFENYNRPDASHRLEYSPHSAYKGLNGTLYFGATGSVTVIDRFAQTSRGNPHPPAVEIREVKMLGEPSPFSQFSRNVPHRFSYWQNSVSVEYSVLDFSEPVRNQSKYRLVSITDPSPDWQTAGGNNIVQYQSLSPGTYRFEVMGANNDEVWNETPAQFGFSIAPPFWETWWFRLCILSCLVLAVIAFIRWRLYRIQRINRQLEQQVQIRTSQLIAERDYSHQIIKSSPSIILGFYPDGQLSFLNPAACELFDVTYGELPKKLWWTLPVNPDEQNHLQRIHQQSQWITNERFESVITGRNQKTRQIDWNLIHSYDEAGDAKEIIAFGNDVTERIQKEVIEVSNREQQRIGREIHDSLCQQLTGIGMMCESLIGRKDPLPEKEVGVLKQIRKHIKRVTTQSRNLAHGLYLHELEQYGLQKAIQELTINVQELFSVPCQWICPQPFSLDNYDQAVHVYRIVQEALSNAVKYSRSDVIQVIVENTPSKLGIRVVDHGIGFDLGQQSKKGMGINVMRFRARMIDAKLEIQSAKDKGTTVTCTLPKL